jgi:hypothetical protein
MLFIINVKLLFEKLKDDVIYDLLSNYTWFFHNLKHRIFLKSILATKNASLVNRIDLIRIMK